MYMYVLQTFAKMAPKAPEEVLQCYLCHKALQSAVKLHTGLLNITSVFFAVVGSSTKTAEVRTV